MKAAGSWVWGVGEAVEEVGEAVGEGVGEPEGADVTGA
jgi:hypothetical protein